MEANLPMEIQGEVITQFGEIVTAGAAAHAKATVESRYYMALKAPRDWDQVRQDALKEARRPRFAADKSAYYNKPIGKGVEGLGIRSVEMILRCMKNVLIETPMVHEDEVKEVYRVMVTDLESNTTYQLDVKITKTVERSKPADDGSYISSRLNSYGKPVYTVKANDDDLLNKRGALISKAIRNLGLRVIPGDIQDEVEETILKVRADKAAQDPDTERKKICDAFATLNIGPEMLKEYLDHDIGTCTPAELVALRGLYGALDAGEATWKTVMDNIRQQRSKSDFDKAEKRGVKENAAKKAEEEKKKAAAKAKAEAEAKQAEAKLAEERARAEAEKKAREEKAKSAEADSTTKKTIDDVAADNAAKVAKAAQEANTAGSDTETRIAETGAGEGQEPPLQEPPPWVDGGSGNPDPDPGIIDEKGQAGPQMTLKPPEVKIPVWFSKRHPELIAAANKGEVDKLIYFQENLLPEQKGKLTDAQFKKMPGIIFGLMKMAEEIAEANQGDEDDQ